VNTWTAHGRQRQKVRTGSATVASIRKTYQKHRIRLSGICKIDKKIEIMLMSIFQAGISDHSFVKEFFSF